MFLKKMTISAGETVIREIEFRKGINLIVDETDATRSKETGNNVGKTTVLMLVDFCLGGSAKNIYTDPENKREEYKLVKDYLVSNKILVTLVLKEDLDDKNSAEICIERNFLSRSQMIRRINGRPKTEDDFEMDWLSSHKWLQAVSPCPTLRAKPRRSQWTGGSSKNC